MFSFHFGHGYSPDSYYYFLLGKSFVSGHGYMTSVIRENLPEANFYSRSYPPVMPILVGLTDKLLHTQIASGLIVDLLALYGSIHICYLLGIKIIPRFYYLLPTACVLFVLTNAPFADEVIAGRSIPVAMLMFLLLTYLSVEEHISPRCYTLLGGCLGLMYLTRFDVSLFLIILPPVLCAARKDNMKNVLFMYGGALLIVSPWIARNLVTFGRPVVSSNWAAVISVYDSDMPTLLFFRNGVPSGLHYPQVWTMQRLFALWHDIGYVTSALVPLGIASFLSGVCAFYLCAQALVKSRDNNLPVFTCVGIALLWLVVNLVTVAVTKLPDERYFSIAILLTGLAAVVSAVYLCKPGPLQASKAPHPFNDVSFLFAAAMIAAAFVSAGPQVGKDVSAQAVEKIYADFKPFIKEGELVGDYWYADNFAYYTDWKLIYFPVNVKSPDDPDFIAWKQHFNVSYVIIMDQSPFVHYPKLKILARSGGFVLIDVKG